MKPKLHLPILSVLIALGLLLSGGLLTFAAPPSPVPASKLTPPPKTAGDGMQQADEAKGWPYIIRLADQPLATYRGSIGHLRATSPRVTGQPKLEVNRQDSRAYLNYLADQQARFTQQLARVAPLAQVLHTYRVAYNGLSATLTPTEAERVARLPGVVSVQRDVMHQLVTDTTPQFIGATSIWNGTAAGLAIRAMSDATREQIKNVGTKGEGVIVAVIDTGVWPEHPSFADDGTYPPPPADWGGDCTPPADDTPGYACNNKLIGIQFFLDAYVGIDGSYDGLFLSGRDDNGHGTHTASTAAGNENVNATLLGVSRDRISGIAPRAHVATYKACGPRGCTNSDLIAAIDKAVADGVDVINYSIGSIAVDPWDDSDSLAFLAARETGVFVAVSAGNGGPAPDTINSPANAPWVTSVGASTSNRHFISEIALSGPGEPPTGLWGASITDGITGFNLVDAAGIPDSAGDNSGLCLNPFSPNTFQPNDAVLCRRGEIARVLRGDHVAAGGGRAVILYNPERQGISLDNYIIPAVHVESDVGELIKDYIQAHPGEVTISFTPGIATFGPENRRVVPDMMGVFSSRGPNGPAPAVIKPDVTAPGVQILAGASPEHISEGARGELFQVMQGTSMSGPHVAGAAALLRALYPDWSPAVIQSALMTTALTQVIKEDRKNPANPFDAGAGRIDLTHATDPGLVFEMTIEDYQAGQADPTHMNLPSLGFGQVFGRATVTRTATSLLDVDSTWSISVTAPSGVAITVSPDPLVVPAKGTATFQVSVDAVGMPEGWYFAHLFLTDGIRQVHLPIAFENTAAAWSALDVVTTQFDADRVNLELHSGVNKDPFMINAYGLVGATKTQGGPLEEDPDRNPNTDPLGKGFELFTYTLTSDVLWFVAQTDDAEGRDVDLFLLYDTDGSDTFDWPDEILDVSGTARADEEVGVMRPAPGKYLVAVHAFNGSGIYTLKTYQVTPATRQHSLQMLNAPDRITAATRYKMQVAWNHPISEGEDYFGVVTFGTQKHPMELGFAPLRVIGDVPAVQKTVSRDEVHAGENLDYEIILTNTAGQERQVVLTDTIPANLSVDPASIAGGATLVGGVIAWSGTLPAADESGLSSHTITYRAQARTGGNATNIATVTSGVSHDSASTSTTIVPVAAEPPAGTFSLLVRVFLDLRCNGIFTSGRDRALADVPVTLTFANGATITRKTVDTGLSSFAGFDAADPVVVSVRLPSEYRGRALAVCDNSSTGITLTSQDFGRLRSKFVTFRAKPAGEVAGP